MILEMCGIRKTNSSFEQYASIFDIYKKAQCFELVQFSMRDNRRIVYGFETLNLSKCIPISVSGIESVDCTLGYRQVFFCYEKRVAEHQQFNTCDPNCRFNQVPFIIDDFS